MSPLAFPRQFPELHAEGLHLRELREEDLPAWFARLSDPEAAALAGDPVATSMDDVVAGLAHHRRAFAEGTGLRWAIVPDEDGASVGSVGLVRIDCDRRTAEIGAAIGRDHWGRGIASRAGRTVLDYAFSTLGLEAIEAVALPENARTLRILERLRFAVAETCPPARRVGGRADSCFLRLAREVWLAAVVLLALATASSASAGEVLDFAYFAAGGKPVLRSTAASGHLLLIEVETLADPELAAQDEALASIDAESWNVRYVVACAAEVAPDRYATSVETAQRLRGATAGFRLSLLAPGGAVVARTTRPLIGVRLASAIRSSILERAVADPRRSDADRARDETSHPFAVMRFFGVEPGLRVLDLRSGGGYYSELLSYAVGPGGEVVAHTNDIQQTYRGDEIEARYAANRLPNVRRLHSNAPDLRLGEDRFDLVLLALVYHDVYYVSEADPTHPKVDRDRFLGQIFRALAPGGVLAVVDHAALPGTGSESAQTLHRIDEKFARKDLEAAGFVFESSSNVLRNPRDDRRLSAFDDRIRRRTDRFVQRYRKPAE